MSVKAYLQVEQLNDVGVSAIHETSPDQLSSVLAEHYRFGV